MFIARIVSFLNSLVPMLNLGKYGPQTYCTLGLGVLLNGSGFQIWRKMDLLLDPRVPWSSPAWCVAKSTHVRADVCTLFVDKALLWINYACGVIFLL